ncbi:MAG: ATP-binding protein [Flavobacteriales bacterium]|nr:ATP-binding protein [Flavobacteriales bacterium]
MIDNSEKKWLKQIAQGENIQQEFKFRIDSSCEIAQTLCAFANTKGGIIWVGIKDNGKISGCNPDEEFHMIAGAARLYCFPEVKVNVTTLILQGKPVLRCEVPVSDLIPHFAKIDDRRNLAFIRHNDFNAVASRVIIKLMKQEMHPSKKPEVFKPYELILLNVLKGNSNCSISKLVRLTGFPLWRVENLLVRFIRWELVKINIQPQGIRYELVSS